MTGAEYSSKSGQAMAEFLVGLVGIVILVLGLNLVMQIVLADFDSLIGSRDEVAESLTLGTSGMAYDGAGAYQPQGRFFDRLQENIRYGVEYTDYLEGYKQTPSADGFAPVASSDPLADVVGARGATTIPIESDIMQNMIGTRIQINNAVWMPTWDDLMY